MDILNGCIIIFKLAEPALRYEWNTEIEHESVFTSVSGKDVQHSAKKIQRLANIILLKYMMKQRKKLPEKLQQKEKREEREKREKE